MTNWQQRLTFAGMCTALISVYLVWSTLSYWWLGHLLLSVTMSLLACFSLAVTFMLFHAASMRPAASHTIRSLTISYIVNHIIIPPIGKYCFKKFIKMTDTPQKYQDEVLMEIIRMNCQTEFGRDYKLNQISSRTQFTKNFPLTTFAHYDNYVERVANGEMNVMTRDKVFHLCISSGTTGKNKMYPLTNSDLKRMLLFATCIFKLNNDLQQKKMDRYFCLRLCVPLRKSKGGINIGGLTMARNQSLPDDVVPQMSQKIYQEEPSYFVQAVFGLREPDVSSYQCFSSDLTHAFFNYLGHKKEELYEAIATGHIKAMAGLEEDVRNSLNDLLTPMPERAQEVLKQIKQGPERLARRLWPKLRYALVCRGGGFAHTASILEKTYLKDVNFCMGSHIGTEGFYGFSISPEDGLSEIYTFSPGVVFLEFIKIEDMEKSNPKTFLLEELEVGQCYELVVTNFNGLYRNRFGDVIKVVGYTNNTPKYVFQYRTGQILNCGFDRTSEQTIFDTLKKTESQWKIPVENYTTVENVHLDAVTGNKAQKNHYVVFIELQCDRHLSQEHQQMLETNLQNQQESYAEFRAVDRLGPIKIIQVAQGTFNGLRHVLYRGYQNQQFKMPRVLRNPDALKYLLQNRITA